MTTRAEEYVVNCRESFDIAVSRAVARLNILAELCLPYVKVGGVFLAMKGQLADVELEEAKKGIALLGGKVERVFEYEVADAIHRAVIIRKEKPAPPKYPRPFAKIVKRARYKEKALQSPRFWTSEARLPCLPEKRKPALDP